MATIGEVNAHIPDTIKIDEKLLPPIKLYFGVFFDGTSNNMVDKATAKKYRASSNNRKEWEIEVRASDGRLFDNGANQLKAKEQGRSDPKYSNVAILHCIYQALSVEELQKMKESSEVKVYNIYVEGAGTDAIYDGGVIDKLYNWKGSVSGKGHSGVSKLVCKAVQMVRMRLAHYKGMESNIELHFDVFGFSRGATCARLFSFLTVRSPKDILPCEAEFKDSVASAYYYSDALHFLDTGLFKSVTVDFLGLFDTVSSIGAISADTYINNVTDYGLYSPTETNVKSTFHICAMDEYREHFALTDIGEKVDEQNAEVFIPGCHSDVGGGYVDSDDSSFIITVGKLSNSSKYVAIKEYCRFSFPMEKINEVGVTSKMDCNTFLRLGWIDDSRQYSEQNGVSDDTLVAKIDRKVKCGYSNIPLEMMSERSILKTKRTVFRAIPKDYEIDKSIFGEWSKQLLESVNKNGRQLCYPGQSYSSDSYCRLRKYLHFSSKNMIGFTPSYNENTICRYVYHGDKGKSERFYTNNAYSNG